MTTQTTEDQGSTVVITHRVRDDRHEAYETWLNEIGPLCRSYPGNLDWQIVRPIVGLTTTYTVIIRFATDDELRHWMNSSDRKRLIENVQPILADEDTFSIRSGLEFWFTPEGAKVKMPVRWKQFLVTWSAIYPLALVTPLAVAPAIHRLGLPDNHYLTTLCVTGIVVLLMTYVVMPRYTHLIRRWLYQ